MRHNLSHFISSETNLSTSEGCCFIISHTNCTRTVYDVLKIMLDHDGMVTVLEESSIPEFSIPLSMPITIPNFLTSLKDLNVLLSFKSSYKILSDTLRRLLGS